MNGSAGTAEQVISLPQGGGAVKGLGEKFGPDPHTGTGNVSIPIAIPAGRNGLQPELVLSYSTGNGNGPLGLGWALGVPGVARSTAKGVPLGDDARDRFVLSGAEDLVPVPGGDVDVQRYRPRTEGLFARIEHRRGAGDYWSVAGRDGLVSVYGTPRPPNADAGWRDPAAVTDPTDPRRVFAWRLTRTTDPFGNTVEYAYERDPVQQDGPHHWDQLYLAEIRYTDQADPASFLVTVTFQHEPRPDPFADYRAGFEIRTVRRCTGIEVATHAGPERRWRSYHLGYLDLDQAGPGNGVSMLGEIRVQGHDGELSEWLPPVSFDYTRFEPDRRDLRPVTGTDLPANVLGAPGFELIDVTGNGLPDLVELNGAARVWANEGEGRFGLPRPMADAPSARLTDPGVQLIDANGDGRIDLLVSTEQMSGYYPMRYGGLWDRRSFRRYRTAPSFDLGDPAVRLVDLDGDGVTDAIRSGTRLECFFNDPETGWGEVRWQARQAAEVFPDVDFADPRVRWSDMSGDGLTDVVLVTDGGICYWPALGHGEFGARIQMVGSPRFPAGHDPRRVLLGDVDGDGLADLVYVEDTKVTLWLNQSGNGWSDPIEITGTPPVSDLGDVRITDLLGTGVGGVLWSGDGGAGRSMFFLDFTGGVKPYLMSGMDNHLGAVTRVDYAPSTRCYLTDQRHRSTRWQTPLPFPVQVVAKVVSIDAISGGRLTTEYSYRHGYWDGAEREFRGFGRVDQRDTEESATPGVAFSPPVESRTWFHEGPVGDEFGDWAECDFTGEFWAGDPAMLSRSPDLDALLSSLPRRARRDALRALRGRVLRTELYTVDGTDRPYTVTEHGYGVREVDPPTAGEDRSRVFFPFAVAERSTQWERGSEPMTRFGFTGDYDAYGQPRSAVDIAVPRGRDPRVAGPAAEPYLATQVVTEYAQRDDAERYCVDRVARSTSFEIVNDGSTSAAALRAAVEVGQAQRRLFGQTRNFYDGPAFVGLPLSQLGDHGAPVRTEQLVLTEDVLAGDVPPYLVPGPASWPAEYRQEFRDRLAPLAGYVFHPGGADPRDVRGWFTVASRRAYDVQLIGTGRGLVLATRDPFGAETAIEYDEYDLLPVSVTDPVGLTQLATYDYRVLAPLEVTDPNGNRTRYVHTPLGLLASTAVMGKEGEDVGDAAEVPGARLVYDLHAFAERGQPASVRTIRREQHVTDLTVPAPDRDATIETVEYSDGFGRLLQTRTQAEDVLFGDPDFGGGVLSPDQATGSGGEVAGRERGAADPQNVVVSGWQLYDNKGRVVEKYEPFFDTGWDYRPPAGAQLGQRVRMFYDPRGQVIRTVNPDGSEQRVLYGVPADLTNPAVFAATPWEVYTYDANDNAGRTHQAASLGYAHHWDTPASAVIDALGRTVETVERNRDDASSPIVEHRTRTSYDIRGNPLVVTDTLGRDAFTYTYDLANSPLRTINIDAGERRGVLDAAGGPVEQRDSKGALTLYAYDVLHRPDWTWARDGLGQPVTLRELVEYGDEGDHDANRLANRLGRPHRHFDEAGLLTFDRYDFKGNVAEKARRVVRDSAILSVFDPPPPDWQVPPFQLDWTPPADVETLLEPDGHHTTLTYDALNRVTTARCPQDVSGARKELRPHYNRAGALESVTLDGEIFVERIAHDAKGQRTLIAYGNGVLTRHAYDPRTFRLVRMRTERYAVAVPLVYQPTGVPLQELGYDYDLAGNITAIHDRTPGSGVPNTPLGVDALDRIFGYDALYRLRSATGRESDVPPPAPPWQDTPKPQDVNLTRAYTERYGYDLAGNVATLGHQTTGGGFLREFDMVAGNNRLNTMTSGQTTAGYAYDVNGNLLRETSSRHFDWDRADRMRVYRTQVGNTEPSVHAHYLYDAAGQRVKKLIRKQGGRVEVTVYIDGAFEYQRVVTAGSTVENNTLHVMDDQSRIATVRIGQPFPDDTTPAVKYHLGDHLGSSSLVVDGAGGWINREEYTPYGETSFGSFAYKRYRFTGKERDEESGLTYHSARYYAPWLDRWMSTDPAGAVDGMNLYRYARSAPMSWRDPNGLQSSEADEPVLESVDQHAVREVEGQVSLPREPSEAPPASEIMDQQPSVVPASQEASVTLTPEWVTQMESESVETVSSLQMLEEQDVGQQVEQSAEEQAWKLTGIGGAPNSHEPSYSFLEAPRRITELSGPELQDLGELWRTSPDPWIAHGGIKLEGSIVVVSGSVEVGATFDGSLPGAYASAGANTGVSLPSIGPAINIGATRESAFSGLSQTIGIGAFGLNFSLAKSKDSQGVHYSPMQVLASPDAWAFSFSGNGSGGISPGISPLGSSYTWHGKSKE
ncbi:SpvB/TcaC N-terminal domain-containing protein [Actinophytocola sp.]|uniref:SpvB/TcaC N-terminal domain-containing protein n=1 Tax=Actinophytocola sp. TaxID=1872138 RepID=UPI0025C60164|nr:SpvB/TcaC N-terminal domain-containing protein [Actinophytocola sp.]